METVPALFATGLQHLVNMDLRVDFSQVKVVDSAAVSMLLGWARVAKSKQRNLHVKGLPEALLNLARLYSVEEFLPRQSD